MARIIRSAATARGWIGELARLGIIVAGMLAIWAVMLAFVAVTHWDRIQVGPLH